MHTFNIFIKEKKIHFTNSFLVYTMLFLTIALGVLKDEVFDIENKFIDKAYLTFAFSVLGYGLLSKIYNFSAIKRLKGKLCGHLIFYKEKIVINEIHYHLHEIQKIGIYVFDYKGLFQLSGKANFDPCLSNGVNNKIIIYLHDGTKISCNFQLIEKKELLKIKQELVYYYENDKFDFSQLTELLQFKESEIEKIKNSKVLKTGSPHPIQTTDTSSLTTSNS